MEARNTNPVSKKGYRLYWLYCLQSLLVQTMGFSVRETESRCPACTT